MCVSAVTMDSIKKKMKALIMERDKADERNELTIKRSEGFVGTLQKEEERNEKTQRNIQHFDAELDQVLENVAEAKVRLSEADKRAGEAELEMASLQRKIVLLEECKARSQERLIAVTSRLDEASKAADENEKDRKFMESNSYQDDESIYESELQVSGAQHIAEDGDRKYDEVARKVPVLEADLERSEDRFERAENHITTLEHQLKMVGNTMKSLEASEQDAIQREESFDEQIRTLSHQLKEAEERADIAERAMSKLQTEIYRLTKELRSEGGRYQALNAELDRTLDELAKL